MGTKRLPDTGVFGRVSTQTYYNHAKGVGWIPNHQTGWSTPADTFLNR